MKNYLVVVSGQHNDTTVVVDNIQQASGLLVTNASRGYTVTVQPTDLPITHKNTYSAQATIAENELRAIAEPLPVEQAA